jgi:hypothetical protein
MHMLPVIGMHMHPAPRIRLDPNAPTRALMARAGLESKRAKMNIGAGCVERTLMDTKNAGRAAPPGDRFLALCLTWRQEAANHHDFDCLVSLERMPDGVKGRAAIVHSADDCTSPYRAWQMAYTSSRRA